MIIALHQYDLLATKNKLELQQNLFFKIISVILLKNIF